MTQLGKYSTDRDCILHFLCTSEWSNDSFGDCEAPTGYVWRISNAPADVHIPNTEVTSLIEDELTTYDIDDTPEFRASLVGHFVLIENSQGFVHVLEFSSELELIDVFNSLQDEYSAWASDDTEQDSHND